MAQLENRLNYAIIFNYITFLHFNNMELFCYWQVVLGNKQEHVVCSATGLCEICQYETIDMALSGIRNHYLYIPRCINFIPIDRHKKEDLTELIS